MIGKCLKDFQVNFATLNLSVFVPIKEINQLNVSLHWVGRFIDCDDDTEAESGSLGLSKKLQ